MTNAAKAWHQEQNTYLLVLSVLDFTKGPLICMHLGSAVEKRNRPPLEGGRRRESEAMRHNAHLTLLLLTSRFVCGAHWRAVPFTP